MTFSTSNPPRIGSTSPALTSLGAVGGPRGAGAGALRILVEFLTTYDKSATQQLENDLRQLDHAAHNSALAEQKRQERLLQVRGKLAEAEKLRIGVLDSAQRSELKQIEALAASRSKSHKTEAAQRKLAFDGILQAKGLRKDEIDLLYSRLKLEKEAELIGKRNRAGDATQARIAKQRLAVEEQISKVQLGRASLGPKVGALALGVVGGAIGAGLIGAGFQVAGVLIDQMVEQIQNLIDPARRAREALKGVAEAVQDISKAESLTILEASAKYLEQIGITADKATAALLAKAVVDQRALELLTKQAEAAAILAHNSALESDLRKQAREAILQEAVARGILTQAVADNDSAQYQVYQRMALTNAGLDLEEEILKRVAAAEGFAAAEAFRLKAAQEAMARGAAQATLSQELLAAALSRATTAGVSPLQAQLNNLQVTPSRRTQRLERALNAGSGGSGVGQQLQNIAEERALILLRQRLRLLGTAINLEKYSGKFLLEAINAKINALQKEGREQERVNQLLDLQYRMSQTIRRSQGESISDFLARRAKENRDLLAEEDQLERQRQIEKLELLREKVQDEVALAQLAEQRKSALAGAGAAARNKMLQKELEASKKKDKEAYEAKKKALEAQIKAEEAKNKEVSEILKDSVMRDTRILIAGAASAQELAALQGRIQGYRQAKATIQGLVEAFGLPRFIAAPFLEKIDALLNAYYKKRSNYINTTIPGRVGGIPLQHGGVLALNNASTPFGQNVQLGEGGTELGVVLSHKVAAILQKQKGVGQIGPFYVNGSQDPLRDKYMLGRTVKEAISEALA